MKPRAIGGMETAVPPNDVSSDARRGAGPSDAELVARALAGDRWAEDAMFRRHAPRLLELAGRLLQRHAEADDVVQDVFVTAFDKLSALRDASALGPWLNRIAVNLVRRRLRLRALRTAVGLDAGCDDASLACLAKEGTRPDLKLELEDLDKVLRCQPTERRLAFMLHRIESMSLRETAEATGRSVATIKRYVAAVDSELARECGGGRVLERLEPGACRHD